MFVILYNQTFDQIYVYIWAIIFLQKAHSVYKWIVIAK